MRILLMQMLLLSVESGRTYRKYACHDQQSLQQSHMCQDMTPNTKNDLSPESAKLSGFPTSSIARTPKRLRASTPPTARESESLDEG